MASDFELTAGKTVIERIARYREMAAQFREWVKTEHNEEARVGLLDMAAQYDRLAKQLTDAQAAPNTERQSAAD
jgi:hypothetical protein